MSATLQQKSETLTPKQMLEKIRSDNRNRQKDYVKSQIEKGFVKVSGFVHASRKEEYQRLVERLKKPKA